MHGGLHVILLLGLASVVVRAELSISDPSSTLPALLTRTSAHVVSPDPAPPSSRLPAYAALLVSAVLKRARTAAWSVQQQCSSE